MALTYLLLVVTVAVAVSLDDASNCTEVHVPTEDETSLLQLDAWTKRGRQQDPEPWNCESYKAFKKIIQPIFEQEDIKSKLSSSGVTPAHAEQDFLRAYLGEEWNKAKASAGEDKTPNANVNEDEAVFKDTWRCQPSQPPKPATPTDVDDAKAVLQSKTIAANAFHVEPVSKKAIEKYMSVDLTMFQGSQQDVNEKAKRLHLQNLKLISLEDLDLYKDFEHGLNAGLVQFSQCNTRRFMQRDVVIPAAMQTCQPFVPTAKAKTFPDMKENKDLDFIFVSHLWDGREISALSALDEIQKQNTKKEYGTHVYICLYSNNQCIMKLGQLRKGELNGTATKFKDQKAFDYPLGYWKGEVLSNTFGDLTKEAKTFLWLAERLQPGKFKWNFDELSDFIAGRAKGVSWIDFFFFAYSNTEDACAKLPRAENRDADTATGLERRKRATLMPTEHANTKEAMARKSDPIQVTSKAKGVEAFLTWAKFDKMQCTNGGTEDPKDWAACVAPYQSYITTDADRKQVCERACKLIGLMSKHPCPEGKKGFEACAAEKGCKYSTRKARTDAEIKSFGASKASNFCERESIGRVA